MNPKNPSEEELYQKYIKEGYWASFAALKAKDDYEKSLINIPFTMPDKVPAGYPPMGD